MQYDLDLQFLICIILRKWNKRTQIKKRTQNASEVWGQGKCGNFCTVCTSYLKEGKSCLDSLYRKKMDFIVHLQNWIL